MSSTIGRMPSTAAPIPRPDERGLRDGGVPNALRAEAVEQSGGGGEDTAVGADVFTHHKDGLVSRHALADRLLHCLGSRELAPARLRLYGQHERLLVGQRGGHECAPSEKT